MEMSLGSRAATHQRWDRKIAIQPIIKEIQERHPRASKEKLIRLLADRMREDEEALIAAAEYAVHNTISAQEGYTRRTRPALTQEQRTERAAEIDRAAKQAVNQILLLNLEMPNGKRMRYCTGEEMSNFGAGYQRIAKKVGKTAMVGSKLSELEVRALMV